MKFFSDPFIFPTLSNSYLLSLLTQVSHIYQVPLPYKTLCQELWGISFLLTQPSHAKFCLFLLRNEKISSERQHKTAYLVIPSLQMGELGFELGSLWFILSFTHSTDTVPSTYLPLASCCPGSRGNHIEPDEYLVLVDSPF